MNTYIYDGTFEGLLTAIHEAYYIKEKPDSIVTEANYQENLLTKKIPIQTDYLKADKVSDSIIKKISYGAFRKVYCAFLSEIPESGMIIYKYLRLGWKVGREVDSYLALQEVLDMQAIFKKVSYEEHRMLGLIRFRKLEGDIYYAPIQPDYNIVELLASHFAIRFNDQKFIIHDVGRSKAVVYNRKEWTICGFKANEILPFDVNEQDIQNLWKGFFNSIAIKTKINPGLQKRFMPKRYWKYLIEKQY